jgi:hypothetical protein
MVSQNVENLVLGVLRQNPHIQKHPSADKIIDKIMSDITTEGWGGHKRKQVPSSREITYILRKNGVLT